MSRLSAVAVFAFWTSTGFAADPNWIRMPSANFNVVTSVHRGKKHLIGVVMG